MWQVVFLLAYGLGLWLMNRSREKALLPQPPSRPRDWEDAAKRCGVRVAGASRLYPKFTARIEPFEVLVETFGTDREDTRIKIQVPMAPDFRKVKIRPQTSRTARDVTDIMAGDPGFDDALILEGPALTLLALLDAETRRHVRAVTAVGRLEISRHGWMEAVISKDGLLSEVLPALLAIGKRLCTPVEIPRSLVENVKRDTESGVRLQNLRILVRELPGDPGTDEAVRAACSDWSPAVRLQAGKALGTEGRGILLALAQGLYDDDVSAEAVSSLDRALPPEEAKVLLDHAVSLGRPKTARACLEVLGRGGAAGEALLIETLQHEKADIQVAAAIALGRIGSAAAVLPLKEAAKRFGRDLGFGQAARRAIAEIQSRVEGASPGQLSLAGTEAGQLSLTEDPAGQLSLGDD